MNAKPAKTATETWTTPRTADGQPDLQGVWANNSATPLERPKVLEGRAFLTDQEVAALKKKAAELFDNGNSDAAFGDTVFESVLANVKGTKSGFKSTDGGTGDYSSVWTVARDWDNRTSLITDPPDGRMPPMTPEAREAARRVRRGERPAVRPRGSIAAGTLHHVRLAAAGGGIPELLSDCADVRLGGHPDGDDSRCACHSNGWASASAVRTSRPGWATRAGIGKAIRWWWIRPTSGPACSGTFRPRSCMWWRGSRAPAPIPCSGNSRSTIPERGPNRGPR